MEVPLNSGTRINAAPRFLLQVFLAPPGEESDSRKPEISAGCVRGRLIPSRRSSASRSCSWRGHAPLVCASFADPESLLRFDEAQESCFPDSTEKPCRVHSHRCAFRVQRTWSHRVARLDSWTVPQTSLCNLPDETARRPAHGCPQERISPLECALKSPCEQRGGLDAVELLPYPHAGR